jgi:hypothetical protein
MSVVQQHGVRSHRSDRSDTLRTDTTSATVGSTDVDTRTRDTVTTTAALVMLIATPLQQLQQ